MTTINKLTRTDTVTAGDVVPVYVQNQGDARGAAMSVLLEYIQAGIEFPVDDFAFVTQRAGPSITGFSVQITDSSINTHLILTPTAAFASGSIVLPAAANAIDNQEILVNTTQAVTALTISGNGASVIGAPSGLSINESFLLKYDAPTLNWYVVSHSVQSPVTTNTTQTLTNKTINGGVVSGAQLLAVDIGGSSTGVLTEFTGLPIDTGVAGLGSGIATFLGAPSSANLAAAVTGETGSGALVFGTSPTIDSPTLTAPALGTPASGVLTNCTAATAATGDSDTSLASTAFVQQEIGVGQAWTNFTLQNGWTVAASSRAAYRKVLGQVQVEIQITGGTAADNTVIATLPVGFRPAFKFVVPVLGAPNAAPAIGTPNSRAIFNTDGTIQISNCTSAQGVFLSMLVPLN